VAVSWPKQKIGDGKTLCAFWGNSHEQYTGIGYGPSLTQNTRIFWVLAICAAFAMLWCLIFARETYAPVLLERKAKKLRKDTGNPDLKSRLDLGITPAELWKRSLLRPMKLMFLSLICALMSLYLAIVYGIMYLLFTTFTFVFEENYGFSQSIVGLVYIGLGVGMLLGLAILGSQSDRIMKALAKKHSAGKLKPEYRLPLLMYAGPFIPVGLFIYGWTAQFKIHWAVPLFGTLLIGVGLLAAFMCLNTYLVDAFERYAASAMAANTILRSVLGAVFPLFGLQMYDALGLGWGNSLLAFISLALCPIPVLFYWYGERIRTHPKFQVTL
jgi:MFS family permease